MNRSDYIQVEKREGIALIWLDQKNEKINKISPDLISLMDSIIDEIENDALVKAAILISRKKDFIAGADIEAFQNVKKPGDFKPITEQGHRILNRMSNSRKPVVAAIHGICYGAGMEIALACHARISSDSGKTKFGLPEVKLGLLPGGGGTQRLPRLVGLQKALDMMLTGRDVYARPAKRMGLVDELVNEYKLLPAAIAFTRKLIDKPLVRKRKKTFVDKILDDTGFGRKMVFKKARERVMKMTQGNYPAPLEILNCAQIGLSKGMDAGLAEEATRFENLILSPESSQLINIFFNMTDKKKNPMAQHSRSIQTIAMLGAGFMGEGITEVSINKGYSVLLKDISDKTLKQAQKNIWKSQSKKVKRKAISRVEAEERMLLIQPQLDYRDFGNADVIIEAVFEDIGLKKKILAEVEKEIRPDCIFASNTSALSISSIAEDAKHPERIIGMHYFSPVPKMPLLEIIVTPDTADWVTASCLDIGIKQGKVCIVVKDGPGFYTTRILAPMMNEALLLMEEGASMDQIDTDMQKFGYPVGPVTLMDEVGIDVGAHIMSGNLMDVFKPRGELKLSQGIRKMSEAGYKGRKNFKGFYQYDPKTGKKVKGKVNTEAYKFFEGNGDKKFDTENLQHRVAMLMVNEAVHCLQDGIIGNPTDGDIGAVFGLGFPPFRGGPFRYIDATGVDQVIDIMEKLEKENDHRFHPCQMLYDMASKGEKFYK